MAKSIWRNSASIILIARIASKAKLIDSNVKLPGKIQHTEYNYRILYLKRGKENKFMPNSYVFPGGALDPADLSAEWLTVFKNADLTYETRGPKPFVFDEAELENAGFPSANEKNIPIHIAARICAIRETFEECGILLARKTVNQFEKIPRKLTDVFVSDDARRMLKWKKEVTANANVFIELCKEKNICPDVWGLHEWSNWLTPTVFKIRFNTLFYTCFIDFVPDVCVDNEEVAHAEWLAPVEALTEFYTEKIILPPPQNYETCRLGQMEDFEKLATFSMNRTVQGTSCWLPVTFTMTDGVFQALPGDEMYPANPNYLTMELAPSINQSCEENRKLVKSRHRGEGPSLYAYRYHCNVKLPHGHLSPAVGGDIDEKDLKSQL